MNNWIGIGNLTKDPELSYTPNTQNARCTFTIAINRPRRNGEDQGADYVRIVVWGKQAESCDRYLSRGRKVAVRGSIRTGSYENSSGAKVYTTDIWAENVEFLGNNGEKTPERTEKTRFDEMYEETFNGMSDSFSAAEDDIPF